MTIPFVYCSGGEILNCHMGFFGCVLSIIKWDFLLRFGMIIGLIVKFPKIFGQGYLAWNFSCFFTFNDFYLRFLSLSPNVLLKLFWIVLCFSSCFLSCIYRLSQWNQHYQIKDPLVFSQLFSIIVICICFLVVL